MMHMPEFVEEFGIYGRASTESHESVHSHMAKAKETLKRMASTKYRTLFARKNSKPETCYCGEEDKSR